MSSFYMTAVQRVQIIAGKVESLNSTSQQLARYFGEAAMRWDELFVIFDGFLHDFNTAQREIEQYKQKQVELERRKSLSATLASRAATSRANKSRTPVPSSENFGGMPVPMPLTPSGFGAASSHSVLNDLLRPTRLDFNTPSKNTDEIRSAQAPVLTPLTPAAIAARSCSSSNGQQNQRPNSSPNCASENKPACSSSYATRARNAPLLH